MKNSSLLVGLSLLVTAATAQAVVTVTLRPGPTSSAATNGDALITPGPANDLAANNYGGAGAIAVSSQDSSKGAFLSLLRFDLDSARSAFNATYGAGGWEISSIVLELTTSSANNPLFNANQTGAFTVKWVADDFWIEGTGNPGAPTTDGVAWNDVGTLLAAAEVQGAFTLASVADGSTAQYLLTPTAGLFGDLAGTTPVTLALADAGSPMSAVFNSRSYNKETRRPALVVTATAIPEPATGALALGGCALLLVRSRRRPNPIIGPP